MIKYKFSVLSHFWSTLLVIHYFLVLITRPNIQCTQPEEINRQHSPNSSSSPLELTQIGEISLWSCLLNNKQNTNLISLIPNRSKCFCFFAKAFPLCAINRKKLDVFLPLHIKCVCMCGCEVNNWANESPNVSSDFWPLGCQQAFGTSNPGASVHHPQDHLR